MVGWVFSSLLGSVMVIGLGALGMIGVILCANVPFQVILRTIHERAERIRARRLSRFTKQSQPKVKSPRAVVAMEQAPTQTSHTGGRVPVKSEAATDAVRSVRPIEKPMEGYKLPPLTLLAPPDAIVQRTKQEIERNIEILENTLQEFGIEAEVVEVAHGPTLTRYEIMLGPGIRVSKVKSLGENIAMSLSAQCVRVEAPIPGKNAIGIEVPNEKRAVVRLRAVASAEAFENHPSRLLVCLGQDVAGENVYADLVKMPHLLIGGATNSGKSIGLAGIITSLLLRNTPKDLRLMLLDPKRVELTLFDEIPHLLCPVVRDIKQMPGALRQIWREMDRRYDRFASAKARNIETYNANAAFADRLPYIVVVIDELADLMIQSSNEVETSICRLAQLARATGIHLVIATQRPSVDVITGTIKANISSRIAYSVSSQVDSRTILDTVGAENLIGNGDMLFLPIDANKPQRIQGCFVSEREISEICTFWRDQAEPEYLIDPASAAVEREEAAFESEQSDPYYDEAVRWVVDRGQASTSLLQRKFSIGFQRASRLLDLMEERGIVAARDGPRPRQVLISPAEVEDYLGS
jgi:S-DNA-T family DNA segregation ATPase FtsK/SpoIIIE